MTQLIVFLAGMIAGAASMFVLVSWSRDDDDGDLWHDHDRW